jgi:hypothetical protein
MQQVHKKPSKEKLMFKVAKGALLPADSFTHERLRVRRYRIGDLVSVSISKIRSPGFNRLAHRIGQLVVENIDDFRGMSSHEALKRLQLEANAGCEEMALKIKPSFLGTVIGYLKNPAMRVVFKFFADAIGFDVRESGMVIVRMPKSLSFESMDQGEYYEVVRKICNHIAEVYWHELDPEQIEHMADSFVEAA